MNNDFKGGNPKQTPPSQPKPQQSPPSQPNRNPSPSGPVYVPGKAVPKVPNPKK